jgi:hypothetical protein
MRQSGHGGGVWSRLGSDGRDGGTGPGRIENIRQGEDQ